MSGIKSTMPKYLSGPKQLLNNNTIDRTGNTFYGTWYLRHSEVHNEQTVPIIMSDALRMHKTAIFAIPLLNRMSQLCSSTPISYNTWKFRQFGHK